MNLKFLDWLFIYLLNWAIPTLRVKRRALSDYRGPLSPIQKLSPKYGSDEEVAASIPLTDYEFADCLFLSADHLHDALYCDRR